MKLKPTNIGIRKKIHESQIMEKLNALGYEYYQTLFEINAIKKTESGVGRWHIMFEIYPDGFLHDSSLISIHKDYGIGRFHGSKSTSKEINEEVKNIKNIFITKKEIIKKVN